MILIGRAGGYAGLHFSADTTDQARGALMQRVEERGVFLLLQALRTHMPGDEMQLSPGCARRRTPAVCSRMPSWASGRSSDITSSARRRRAHAG